MKHLIKTLATFIIFAIIITLLFMVFSCNKVEPGNTGIDLPTFHSQYDEIRVDLPEEFPSMTEDTPIKGYFNKSTRTVHIEFDNEY